MDKAGVLKICITQIVFNQVGFVQLLSAEVGTNKLLTSKTEQWLKTFFVVDMNHTFTCLSTSSMPNSKPVIPHFCAANLHA